MNTVKIINSIKDALKLMSDVDESRKDNGLDALSDIMKQKNPVVKELGYMQVILKELINMIQFESGTHLAKALDLTEENFFGEKEYLDQLAETLIYRVARSNDQEVCRLCLMKISSLVDKFDESIAKHSKQLLKLADLNETVDINYLFIEILKKLRDKLPKRKSDHEIIQ